MLPRVVCRCCKGSHRARGCTRLFGRGTHTTGLGKTNSLQQSCFLVHFGCWRSYRRGRPARQLRQQGPKLETIANLQDAANLLTRLLVLHMSASSVHVHRRNNGATHVGVFWTRTSTKHSEHIRHSSRVSSWCTSNIVAHVEFLSCVERQLPENGSRVTRRHDDLFATNVSVPCGEEREFVISFDLGTLTSTTRTMGDRLTLLPPALVHNYQVYDTYKHGSGVDCCPL